MTVEVLNPQAMNRIYDKAASYLGEIPLFYQNQKRDLIALDYSKVKRYNHIEDFVNRPNLLMHSHMVNRIALEISNDVLTRNNVDIDIGIVSVLSHLHDVTELNSIFGDVAFVKKLDMSEEEKKAYDEEEKRALQIAYGKYYYGDTSSIGDTYPIYGKDLGDKDYKVIYPGENRYSNWEECKFSFDELLNAYKYNKQHNILESQMVKIADVIDAFYEMTHLYFCSGKVVETYDLSFKNFELLETLEAWKLVKNNKRFELDKIPKLNELKKLPHIEGKEGLYNKSVLNILKKYPQFYKQCLMLSLSSNYPNQLTYPDWYGGYYEKIMEARKNFVIEERIYSKQLRKFVHQEVNKTMMLKLFS